MGNIDQNGQGVLARDSLRDTETRMALRNKLRLIHADEPDAAIINELSVAHGEARGDLAVVNGSFSGNEIKSGRDTSYRLPHQLAGYEFSFNAMTIVVGSHHVASCVDTCLKFQLGRTVILNKEPSGFCGK